MNLKETLASEICLYKVTIYNGASHELKLPFTLVPDMNLLHVIYKAVKCKKAMKPFENVGSSVYEA